MSPLHSRARACAGLLLTAVFFVCLAADRAAAGPVPHGFASFILARDTPTDTNGTVSGGAASAQAAAQAAGDSIGTGSSDGQRSTPDSPAAFARLLSGVFFGGLLTLIFGGALAVQVWHYFERFGRWDSDHRSLQIGVWVILVTSILQDAVIIKRLYDIHVAHFGDFAFPLLTVGWELCLSYAIIAVNTSIAQLYFAYRVYLAFSKNRVILVVYATLIAFTLAGGIASAALIRLAGSAANVKGQSLKSFQPQSTPWQFSVVFATWLCSNAFVDISLCFSLIWQLNKMNTPFFRTRYAVARLLLLSLETCVGTATISITSMILFLAVPYQFYYDIPFLPSGNIMASSLLVTLMARPSIARDLAPPDNLQQAPMNIKDLDETSSVLPRSLITPVVKRMMRREQRKAGDGTGVHISTTHEAFNENDDDDDFPHGLIDEREKMQAYSIDPQRSGSRTRQDDQNGRNSLPLYPQASSKAARMIQESFDAEGQYLGSILSGGEGRDLRALASVGAETAEKQRVSAPSVTIQEPSYGRTPRGRLIPTGPTPSVVQMPSFDKSVENSAEHSQHRNATGAGNSGILQTSSDNSSATFV